LQYFKDLLSEHQRQLEEERVAREELEAAKQAKKDQKKRKSTAAKGEDDDVEMAEAGGEKKKSTKKRKKDAESDVEADKVRGRLDVFCVCTLDSDAANPMTTAACAKDPQDRHETEADNHAQDSKGR
jgi:hypothetical protein